jgi:ribonuclease H / adenosylcobalamin/alpha-ribazole phosphatase
MMCAVRVLFLRHAESFSNAHPEAVGLPEERGDRLTPRGWEQSRAAARWLRGLRPDRLLSSPMRRARETAAAISDELGMPIEVSELIHELHESDEYLSLSPEEQKLRRWSVWMAEHGHDPDWSPPGGESFNVVVGRVRDFKRELESGDPEATVLAVSHGIFLRFFLFDSLLEESFSALQVPRLWQLRTANCALSVFEHGERRHPADPEMEGWECVTWMALPWRPAADWRR